MNFNVSLVTDTRQSMLVTRQAIQSVEILQFGQEELDAFVKEQSERNPLINLSSGAVGGRLSSRSDSTRHDFSTELNSIEATVSYKCGLREHLEKQLPLIAMPEQQMMLARYLIGLLDPDGYLRQPVSSISELLDLPEWEIESALKTVQRLEPTGVGARNLAECLRLQLQEDGQLSREMALLLDNLSLVAEGEIQRLAKRCNATVDQVRLMLRQLRRLSAAPGGAFDTDPVCPALPDVVVTINRSGRLRVELNPATLPRVLIDKDYYFELSSKLNTREDRRFLLDCARDANLLTRNLNQRAATILKIAAEIVKRQEGFLRHGVMQMRPLSQKTVAEACGVHESTVSRAIANKYLLCQQGQFPLKFFFSEGLANANSDDDVASETIRHRIKSLVASETTDHILSDDAIAALLGSDGIDVARRTVAKYRGQLKIASSAQRRRMLRLA